MDNSKMQETLKAILYELEAGNISFAKGFIEGVLLYLDCIEDLEHTEEIRFEFNRL